MWHTRAMDHPLIDLINARIATAERDGAFDNLEGAGAPLPRCDDPDAAFITRILKENGAVPEAVALHKDIARLRETLLDTDDRTRRKSLLAEIALLETRLEMARKG